MRQFFSKMLGEDPSVSSGRIAGIYLVLVGSGLCILAAVTKNTIAITAGAACLTAGLTALGIKGLENVKRISAEIAKTTAPPAASKPGGEQASVIQKASPPAEKVAPKD